MRDGAGSGPGARPEAGGDLDRLRAVAGGVGDPEIPVLTLDDLGIVRDVRRGDGDLAGTVLVDLTPTYTGCPATEVIAADVTAALRAAGADRVLVRTVLSPAWTTDWISEAGRRKLREYGSAPRSAGRPPGPHRVALTLSARCPWCGSGRTREVSRFGATPCRSHWTCRSCLEPFDSFKAI
ncbi:1,2-phenylacetyl-CoA epoxidase subunit PaaD [Nakamurella sp.]|uniref:1,2-phenylacetyl-CoA epoxidase subunit PaaD n=1 Tax=Nakamurella sp. TaxID=1869182 RepID=UPI003B3B2A36